MNATSSARQPVKHKSASPAPRYKRLANDFTATDWRNPEETNPFGVSNKTTTYCDQGLTTSLDEAAGRNATRCGGHHADDVALFYTMTKNDDTGLYEKMRLSNQQLFTKINPNDYRMPYIYDSFEWDHCSDSGYTFSRLDWADEIY